MPPKKRQSRGSPKDTPEDDTEARDEEIRKTSPPPPTVTVQPVGDKKRVTAQERRSLADSVEAGIDTGSLQSGVALKTGARCTWVSGKPSQSSGMPDFAATKRVAGPADSWTQ